jgi:hypothetical protein
MILLRERKGEEGKGTIGDRMVWERESPYLRGITNISGTAKKGPTSYHLPHSNATTPQPQHSTAVVMRVIPIVTATMITQSSNFFRSVRLPHLILMGVLKCMGAE